MPPPSLWSGNLRLSLVLIPVRLIPAVSTEEAFQPLVQARSEPMLSFVVQRGSILEKQAIVEMQRKTQDITLDTYELTNRIADIRDDLQKLTSMVGRLANSQLSRAQDAAVRTVDDFEEAIRRNPLSALGIALGLGFLVAIFLRR
jgi:ElaB/YqjD/DUF883 family membrane-anchored ribosome-binding protein